MIVKIHLDNRRISVGQVVLVTNRDSSFIRKMEVTDSLVEAIVQAMIAQPQSKGECAFFLTKLSDSGQLEFRGPAPWQDW